MAKPISQSDTRWVKKPGKAGYVEQISTGKKVTGKVKIESVGSTAYNSQGIATYKKGRNTAVSPNVKKKAAPAAAASPRKKVVSTGPAAGTNPKPRTQSQSDMGATKPAKSYTTGSTAGKRSAAMAKAGAVSRIENSMARKAKQKEASRTAVGTPNTGARKYQTPGPDLGAAYSAWKAKPAISVKDRERAAAKSKSEKAARQKVISLIKSRSGKR